MNFDVLVLTALVKDKPFAKKVFPYIKREYFSEDMYGSTFQLIKKYVVKYKLFPTEQTLLIELGNMKDIPEKKFESVKNAIKEIFATEYTVAVDYMIDETERWCKQRSIHNAIFKSIDMLDKKDQLDAIPEMMREALNVEFDNDCGTELLLDSDLEARWNRYHTKVNKYNTGIEIIDKITNGGFETKALVLLFGGSHVGKSAAKVAIAANMLRSGHDVLYITLELSQEKITQRFEANFLDIPINDVESLSHDDYKTRLVSFTKKQVGRLVVKEYPTAYANVNHIRALLDELEIKRNFKPKIIVVDYLNLLLSTRLNKGDEYTVVKYVSQELRGLAVEKDICLLSSSQGNRKTNNSKFTEIELDDIADCISLVAISDCMFGIVYPKELREQNIQIWTSLKNRFGGIVHYKFPIKTAHEKCQIFDHKEEFQISGQKEVEQKMKTKSTVINRSKLNFDDKEFLDDIDFFEED